MFTGIYNGAASRMTPLPAQVYNWDIAVSLARESEEFASTLLRRKDTTDEIAGKLYKYVGNKLRQYIIRNYSISSDILMETLDGVCTVLKREQYRPSPEIMRHAEHARFRGSLDAEMMVDVLRRGEVSYFIGLYATLTDHPVDTVLDICAEESGRELARICKAANIRKPDFLSIFVLTAVMREGSRIITASDIGRAVDYYNRA